MKQNKTEKTVCLFLAVLGELSCMGFFFMCGNRGLLLLLVHRLLIVVASLIVVDHVL